MWCRLRSRSCGGMPFPGPAQWRMPSIHLFTRTSMEVIQESQEWNAPLHSARYCSKASVKWLNLCFFLSLSPVTFLIRCSVSPLFTLFLGHCRGDMQRKLACVAHCNGKHMLMAISTDKPMPTAKSFAWKSTWSQRSSVFQIQLSHWQCWIGRKYI